ncbi:hypothetical protein DICVIV_00086 [Dictyocaulus viviparus]|uniref:Leishmanolysin-like peptidase n=1 Tax=Dictyocaulus viviparus TaxID=29172 RepID=A0A0D8Y9Y1_DICVI|nr:hypothetical protein DICVIV_00086 [Dictyocaulus viviparus]
MCDYEAAMLFLLIVPLVFGCNEISLNKQDVRYGIVGRHEDGNVLSNARVKRNAVWNYIRIEIFYDDSLKTFSDQKQVLLKELIEESRDYFSNTLMVDQEYWMQIEPECDGNRYKDVLDDAICENDCLPKCGDAVAPANVKMFSKCTCMGKKCPTDWSQYEGKLYNTDFVLFVTINQESCSSQTMAFASTCSLSLDTKRPISGFINICPDMFNAMKFNDKSRWSSTIKHELTHSLVFASSHFERFPGVTQVLQNDPITIIPGVVEKFTRTDWEVAGGIIKHDVYMIVTPRVRQEARKHFDCDSLEGAELESQGGTGTAGSHWEKRLFEVSL